MIILNEHHKARIGVVGLRYVGLPLAVEFAAKGFETLGIEVDPKKVNAVNSGQNNIADVDDKVFAKVVKNAKRVIDARNATKNVKAG